MKCLICFGGNTGVVFGDFFVKSQNGHIFHYNCVMTMMTGQNGSPECPMCDENLETQTLETVFDEGSVPPPRPAKPQGITTSSLLANTSNRLTLASFRNVNLVSASIPQMSTPVPPPKALPSCSYQVQPDYIFKIVILGNFNIGKSSLLQRYADEKFDPKIVTTTGCDLRVKVLKIADKNVRLNLWDTAGQERHRAIVDVYLRKADGIIFCFDITDANSFTSLPDWYEFSKKTLPSDTLKIIVGTKYDLWHQRSVEIQSIQNLAQQWQAQHIFSSAKDATNVEAVFRTLAALILETRLPNEMFDASAPPMPFGMQDDKIIKLSTKKKHKTMETLKKLDKMCC